jgi:hypothetical protein
MASASPERTFEIILLVAFIVMLGVIVRSFL